jgi:hypothetical protein
MDDNDFETSTTNKNRTSAAESALAKSCQNQLVVAAMMFSEVTTQMRQRSINVVLEPLRRWFEEQAHILRSVADSVHWMQSQLKGSFFANLDLVVGCLAEEYHIRSVGIQCPSFSPDVAPQQFTEAELQQEDWLCTGMADLALCAVGARICRCAYMIYGWSCRSILWLDARPEVAASEIITFKTEWTAFQAMKAHPPAGFADIIARSQFCHVCVEQLAAACQDANWSTKPTAQLKASLNNKPCTLRPKPCTLNPKP